VDNRTKMRSIKACGILIILFPLLSSFGTAFTPIRLRKILKHPHKTFHHIFSAISNTILFHSRDSEYQDVLEEILYSGDVENVFVRHNQLVISEDFVEFLEAKIGDYNGTDDAEERTVVENVMLRIQRKLEKKGNYEKQSIY
jgi:hypothetical protein